MADDSDDKDRLQQRAQDASDKLGGKKAKAKARFFGMADRLEQNPPKHDDLRDKLNRIRQHVRETEDSE